MPDFFSAFTDSFFRQQEANLGKLREAQNAERIKAELQSENIKRLTGLIDDPATPENDRKAYRNALTQAHQDYEAALNQAMRLYGGKPQTLIGGLGQAIYSRLRGGKKPSPTETGKPDTGQAQDEAALASSSAAREGGASFQGALSDEQSITGLTGQTGYAPTESGQFPLGPPATPGTPAPASTMGLGSLAAQQASQAALQGGVAGPMSAVGGAAPAAARGTFTPTGTPFPGATPPILPQPVAQTGRLGPKEAFDQAMAPVREALNALHELIQRHNGDEAAVRADPATLKLMDAYDNAAQYVGSQPRFSNVKLESSLEVMRRVFPYWGTQTIPWTVSTPSGKTYTVPLNPGQAATMSKENMVQGTLDGERVWAVRQLGRFYNPSTMEDITGKFQPSDREFKQSLDERYVELQKKIDANTATLAERREAEHIMRIKTAVTRTSFDLRNPEPEPEEVKYYADLTQNDSKNWMLVQANRRLADAVRRELAQRGVDVVQLDATTRDMMYLAQTGLPHIKDIGLLIDKLDKQNKLGVVGSRWGEFMSGKLGSSDPAIGGDPDFTKLRDNILLMDTLMGRVHGGARGGGSETMLNHFKSIVNAGTMDAATLRSGMSVFQNWLNSYATVGGRVQPRTTPGEQQPPLPEKTVKDAAGNSVIYQQHPDGVWRKKK